MIDLIEYQNREYCRDVFCETQIDLDSERTSETIKHAAKRECKRCNAYKFHKWLQNNNYKIVKEVNNE